jgi:alkylated DNA repair dioxygenase AlkB
MSQVDFFDRDNRDVIPLNGGELLLIRQAFSPEVAHRLFLQLREQTQWSQDEIIMGGRRVLIPRLQAWYGDAAYRYSGFNMTPLAWTAVLLEIKRSVEKLSEARFNSVLLNLYRDGNDSVGWHSDDEPELGEAPVIASVSLGVSRDFSLRQKKPGAGKLKLRLDSGDLLLMSGQLQHNWQHQLPKTQLPVGERINLTFRLIKS